MYLKNRICEVPEAGFKWALSKCDLLLFLCRLRSTVCSLSGSQELGAGEVCRSISGAREL